MENKLIVGKSYFLSTTDSKEVIMLAETSARDRALFLSKDFMPTPYISWNYRITNETLNIIECYYGHYYDNLEDAVQEEL